MSRSGGPRARCLRRSCLICVKVAKPQGWGRTWKRRENHKTLHNDKLPRSGFVQLLSILPPAWRDISASTQTCKPNNLQQYPSLTRILSRLFFSRCPASAAVYPDISPQYISIIILIGISRYQPAASGDSFPAGVGGQVLIYHFCLTKRMKGACQRRGN